MVGEFGRTVGPLTAAAGAITTRSSSRVFAGGGVKGGRVIGATNETGSDTVDFGWSQQRYVYPEDIEATIYSAVGIELDDGPHRRSRSTAVSRTCRTRTR